MKKIILFVGMISFLLSCSVDTDGVISSENNLKISIASTQESMTYEGVFTTLDSKYRATISIKGLATPNPVAVLKFVGGNVIEVKAVPRSYESNTNEIMFSSTEASFTLLKNNLVGKPTITNARFRGFDAAIEVVESSRLNPATPVLGTWECTVCNSHPVVNTGKLQSLNWIVPAGAGGITTQMIVGTTAHTGIGLQTTCTTVGMNEVCNTQSGDQITTAGFLVNGNPVTWVGTHTYASGAIEESTVSGTWSWESISYGTLTGTYEGTSNLSLLYSENFDTFTGNGFSATPSAGQLNSDVIIANGFSGSLVYGGTATSGDYARGTSTGGVGTGGIYAFEIGGNAALGVQPGENDFTPGEFDFKIENTTGSPLSNFVVSYTLYVRNDQPRSNSFNFSYSTDGINYTAVGDLDFASSEAASGSTFNATPREGAFSALVADGAFIYLRFKGDDISGSGPRDEFALDDLLLQAN